MQKERHAEQSDLHSSHSDNNIFFIVPFASLLSKQMALECDESYAEANELDPLTIVASQHTMRIQGPKHGCRLVSRESPNRHGQDHAHDCPEKIILVAEDDQAAQDAYI